MINLLKSPAETHVLMVDDTPDNLRLLAKILETQGYITRKSLNGKMALQSVYRQPPDIILLDINMPEMTGYEVCQQLKASRNTDNIPIIFISALNQINDKIQAFELGGQDYITKPFQEMEVLIRVKNQLLIKQQYDQLVAQNKRLEYEIQEREKAEAEIRKLSLTDELTGLYNRRGFFWLANQQLKFAQREKRFCCLLFADLDGLKKINDSLGHETGDKAIIDTAKILKQTFRESDIIARIGGDEFIVFILNSCGNKNELNLRLQTNINNFNQEHNYAYKLSISLGVKEYSWNQEVSLEELVKAADWLMYQNKRAKFSIES